MKKNLPVGFKLDNTLTKEKGAKIYTDGKAWISGDRDGHNGGICKAWDKKKNVGSKKGRKTLNEDYEIIKD